MDPRVKSAGKRAIRRVFEVGQSAGVDVLPRHFYSNTPDVRALRADASWQVPRSMAGVRGTDLVAQAKAVRELFTPEVRDVLNATPVHDNACARNGAYGYGPMEAEVLYAYAVTRRPRRVVQVGAGVTTALLLAARQDFQLDMDIVCVDPYPTDFLIQSAAAGDIVLHAVPAQKVDVAVLADPGPDGMLFVDSTHTVKVGSEVNRLILDVLPELRAGSSVHFHDITWPYDYAPGLLDDILFFWNESALLLAYMADNARVGVDFSLAMLHGGRQEVLADVLPRYRPMPLERGLARGTGHYPSAAYLRVD